MRLDESIELENIRRINNKKIIDMKGLGDNINVEQKRKYLQEVLLSEQSDQLIEILISEGFLNITESDDAQIQLEVLLQDDEMCEEIYGSYIQEIKEYSDHYSDFINVKGYDNSNDDINDPRQQVDGDDLVEVDEDDDEEFGDDEGDEEGDDEGGTELPTYLKNMENNLDKLVTKYERFIKNGTKWSKSLPHYFSKLNPNDIQSVFNLKEFDLNGFIEFLNRKEGESGSEYYGRLIREGDPNFVRVFNDFVQPSKRLFISQSLETLGKELKVSGGRDVMDKINAYESMEDTLNELSSMDDDIYRIYQRLNTERDNIKLRREKKQTKPTPNPRLTDIDFNDDDEFNDDSVYPDNDDDNVETLPIQNLPNQDDEDDDEEDGDDEKYDDFIVEEIIKEIKAKGSEVKDKSIDSQNKTSADKENTQITKDAAASQKTINQKVDNLKNQKYVRDTDAQQIKDVSLGFNNALDLDYDGGLSKEQETRIEDLADGLPKNKEDVNVDHESEGGSKLIAAAKERRKNGEKNYTVPPVKTKPIDEQITRMKKIINL